ncbi:hypothetical protein ACFZC3_17115 [Streptomyces sp. NPDC007903]|uniref:hypothetical protein n=1 Tax=Streptomyces sp. NPDC007903 TaxID=3364786 RepID=UPI0036EBC1A1
MALVASGNHDGRILNLSGALSKLTGICGQATATVYDVVAEIYHELLFSELQASLFADTQEKVDGSLAAASGSALDKIERVSDRLRDGDPESVSQALTTCRRLIDSCADYVFPAREGQYMLGDDVNLKVGPQQVLNRLQAYTHACGASMSRRNRLRRTLSDLYDRCSAGTHAEVTVGEERSEQGLQTVAASAQGRDGRTVEGAVDRRPGPPRPAAVSTAVSSGGNVAGRGPGGRCQRAGWRHRPEASRATSTPTSTASPGSTNVTSSCFRLPHPAENDQPVHGCSRRPRASRPATAAPADRERVVVRPTY